MKPSYFLTAYGIARKHGFKGTEVEWLSSLTAFYLAQQAGYKGSISEWVQLLNDPVPAFQIGTVSTLPGGSDATVSLGGTRRQPVLNFGIPRGLGMADALPLVGGTMRGGINMNQYLLYGLGTPTADDHAAPRKYVDDSVKIATAAAAGAQRTADSAVTAAAGAQSTANAAAGAAANAKNTADKKATKLPFTVILSASGWTGSSAPYTQSVELTDILAEDRPYYGPVYSGDTALRIRDKLAYSCIDDLDTADGSVTFTCFDSKPDVDLTIQLEVFR